MITKLNPAAVNDKWGGVLYLELGETTVRRLFTRLDIGILMGLEILLMVG